jgi:hypothetical protein
MVSVWPFSHAQCRAVQPLLFLLVYQPLSRRAMAVLSVTITTPSVELFATIVLNMYISPPCPEES